MLCVSQDIQLKRIAETIPETSIHDVLRYHVEGGAPFRGIVVTTASPDTLFIYGRTETIDVTFGSHRRNISAERTLGGSGTTFMVVRRGVFKTAEGSCGLGFVNYFQTIPQNVEVSRRQIRDVLDGSQATAIIWDDSTQPRAADMSDVFRELGKVSGDIEMKSE